MLNWFLTDANLKEGEIMDINTITQAIGSVGFPIVACCAMFYLYDKTITKITSTLDKVDNTLEKMFDKLDKQ